MSQDQSLEQRTQLLKEWAMKMMTHRQALISLLQAGKAEEEYLEGWARRMQQSHDKQSEVGIVEHPSADLYQL